jgi:hypothetical protein
MKLRCQLLVSRLLLWLRCPFCHLLTQVRLSFQIVTEDPDLKKRDALSICVREWLGRSGNLLAAVVLHSFG